MPHPDEGTIHAWLDGALPAGEAAQLEAHVAGCAECAAAVAEARGLIAASSRILSALDTVPAGVLPAASPPVAARTEDATAATTGDVAREARDPAVVPIGSRPPLRRWRAGSLRAAAALLVVVGGAAVVLRSTDRGEVVATLEQAASDSHAETAPSLMTPPPSALPAPELAADPATTQRNAAPAPAAAAPVAPAVAAPSPRGRSASAGDPRPATQASRAEAREERSASLADRDRLEGVATSSAAAPLIGATTAPVAQPAPPTSTSRSVATGSAASVAPPTADGALTTASDFSGASAPTPDDEAAPALRRVAGWTVLGSAVVRDSSSLVRRTTYRVASGATVTLEESAPRDEISLLAQGREVAQSAERRRAPTAEAMKRMPARRADEAASASAPAPSAQAGLSAGAVTGTGTNTLRWQGDDGTRLVLSGAVDVRMLEALREELRRATRAP